MSEICATCGRYIGAYDSSYCPHEHEEVEVLSPSSNNYTIDPQECQDNSYEAYFYESDIPDLEALVDWLNDLDTGVYGHCPQVGWDHAKYYPALYLLTSLVEDLKRERDND